MIYIWVIYRDAIFQKPEVHFWDEIPLALPFQMTSCEVSIIHIVIWRLPFKSSSRKKKCKETDPKKMTYPMFFLCRFHNFLLVSPTSTQVEALWCPDFHEHFRPPENPAVSRRVAPSVLPWCHSPKEPGRWFRAFSRFCFMGFLWEKLKEKKGISSLTSFSEHWIFGGAHEISKDAHVPTVQGFMSNLQFWNIMQLIFASESGRTN